MNRKNHIMLFLNYTAQKKIISESPLFPSDFADKAKFEPTNYSNYLSGIHV